MASLAGLVVMASADDEGLRWVLYRALRGGWRAMMQQTCVRLWSAPCMRRSCAGWPCSTRPQVSWNLSGSIQNPDLSQWACPLEKMCCQDSSQTEISSMQKAGRQATL